MRNICRNSRSGTPLKRLQGGINNAYVIFEKLNGNDAYGVVILRKLGKNMVKELALVFGGA
jgi:hypothetical protein